MICALSLVLVLAVSFGEMAEVTDLTEEVLPVVNGIYNQLDRDKILARHNQFRSEVQPSAANMVALRWSHDLAGVAQRVANRCDFGFNFRRLVTRFSSVGQNIARVYAGTLDSIMDSWNNEKADYDFETNTCSAFCAHYTQMVWATTSFIGCGRAACPPHSNTYIICNYGPGGDETQRPYESGLPCSSCPDSEGVTYSCENNLCTLG
ncbi:glioma pathogenesis-related protein 1-like [Strongylocentrotus purpuratus]|uniref:SCP domain-containing protein n=1 Tax=Strongylocentrotus purpuratus TaxID=7668 RepID=A0A7M7NRK2_STRPU|nr:glioma pathogenesis-related protein 1-like [Strongylocentrotus purpuratus]